MFSMHLMILCALPNRKITEHKCLDWISQTVLKIKGHGEAFGNYIRNYVFDMWQTHTKKTLLYKDVIEYPV